MHRQMDTVVGTSLLGATGLAESFLDQIVQNAQTMDFWSREELLNSIREGVRQFEPLLAEHLSDAVLAGWITGYDNVAKQFPLWLQQEFTDSIRRGPPNDPPEFNFFGMFDREPRLRLLNVENAAERLMERGIMTRLQFDEAKEDAQRQAFTIAGGLGTDTIDRFRFMLNQELSEGASLTSFQNRVEDILGTSPIAPGHLENVYRTNLQAAFRDGRETLRSNPLVAATFPYQAYIAVHDARSRSHHRDLEKLGLNGTNVYRADDPFWDHFTPPWDYNCRCGVQMLTLEQAAARGVREAQEWLRTGRAPINPQYRLAAIPFEPNPGFGHRGNVGMIVMSASRAPSGYTKDEPLIINGKHYTGGMFIPGDQMEHATAEQKREIADGKKATPNVAKATPEVAPRHEGHEPPKHWVESIATRHQLKLKTGYSAKMFWDGKAKSRGWGFQLSGPDGKQSFTDRYQNPKDAARHAATLLHVRGLDTPTKPKEAKPSESKPAKPRKPKREVKTNQGNWHYDNTDFVSRGAKAKFHDNLAALRTLKTLELEEREATKAEQETISKFVGWGQFPQAFDWRRDYSEYTKWAKERDELHSLVGQEGFDSARDSTINSHYTAPDVIAAHWKMAERLGFKGGKYLEPAVGGGYYLGLMPEHLAEKTNVTAIEMDQTAGAISKALYPSASVHITPFQDHATPNNFFDLVATNVPFSGEIRIHDPKYKAMKPLLHDYYFLRSVDTAKPGGLIMNITSAGTMDKLDPRVRNHIEKHCELVSAVRFPGDTHKANAGTEVVTDMIILRKKNPAIPDVTDETPSEATPEHERFTGTTVDSLGRIYHWVDGVRVPAPRWDDVVAIPDPDGGDAIPINRYFAEHPEQTLGILDRSGTMYAGNMKNVSRTEDYDKLLDDVINRLPENIVRTGDQEVTQEADQRIMVEPGQQHLEGQLVYQDGRLYQHKNGALELQEFDKPTTERIIGQIGIRDAARDLLALQRNGEDTEEARSRLNELYDQFTAKHGPLHKQTNRSAMKLDPDGAFLLSLEHYNANTKKALKADLFVQDTIVPDARAEKADSVPEAIGIVLHETSRVDLQRIASLTGKSIDEVGEQLVADGLAFEDPSSGWQPASEYLSGNTRRKLKEAKAAALADPRFEANVTALEAAQPEDIESDEIGIKLGSPWVPASIVQQFAAETLGANPDDISVKFSPELQTWHFELKDHLRWRSANTSVWGVRNDDDEIVFSFQDAVRAALQGKQPTIRSSRADEDGNRPINKEATNEALQKVDELKAQFKDWVWQDPDRAESLARIYNDTQNTIVSRKFDGSHLTFPGMVQKFKMRQLQKDFVWRVITTGKGFAAHEVGTGKTASMIASAMELRRLGLAKKPTLACLKSNIEQITKEALELYPNAKILSTAKNFDAQNRRKTLHQIATGDYDLIIMTHDHLEAMKMKPESLRTFIAEEVQEIEDAIAAAEASDGDKRAKKSIVKKLANKRQALQEQLKAALKSEDKDQVFFEDSGIDQLFVDEAHNFKSLPCHSREQIKGVPSGRSDRATDMLAKTRFILDNNNGRGVVFATGTPIINTMAELYVMQRYLQPDALKERGLHHFDNWKDTYGETSTEFEFKLNGEVAQTQRFSQFVNLPELRHMTSEFMDIQRADNLFLPDGKTPMIVRPTKHDQVIVSESNEAVQSMMADIEKRAQALKGKRPGGKGDDNMLSVCNDARLGSIDMRLIDADAEDHPESKANRAIREIVRMYHEKPGTTQCVFSDLGINETKASGFSLFEDMKKKLVAAGIPKSEIIDFSDDTMKDTKREEAQAAMKRGEARIAFGSTKRLGTGTNIQKNLWAVHHLDIPYIPAAIEQRDGRGWRSGNLNDPTRPANDQHFHVYKYVQQGSADPLFWQILARKTGFINQYMQGNSKARTMEDISAESLSPDEMISIASGGSDAMERIKSEQSVNSLQRSKMRHEVGQTRIQKTLEEADAKRAELLEQHAKHAKDQDHIASQPEWRLNVGGRAFTERKEAEPVLAEAVEAGMKGMNSLPTYYRKPSKIATYRGLDLMLKPDGLLAIEGPSGHLYPSGTSIASIDHVARSIAKKAEQAKTAIETFETDLAKMREQVGQFRRQSELEQALAKLTELNNRRSAVAVATDQRELLEKG
jgi:N12 class adenine-specific DNA methylase